jgi:phosphatidylglycerophosphate synthase
MPDPETAAPRWAVVDLRGVHQPHPTEKAGPLARVCGLSVLVRNLLLFQRAGLRGAVLLHEPASRIALEAALAGEARLRLRIVWSHDEGDLQRPPDDEPVEILYWPGALSFGRRLPAIATASLGEHLALLPAESPAGGQQGPLVLAGAALGATGSLPELAEQLARDGRAQRVPIELPALLVVDEQAAREAEAALLRSLRKDVDGAVAKFDRYISLAVSRHLMRLQVTPNQVTVAAGVLGVACGVVASLGGYWPMLLAALGFQLNSILDGIDGEIARAKLLESRLGQWMDTLADDSSNLCYAVGLCVGCWHTWHSKLYLGLGFVAGAGFLITAALMYRYIITVAHSGDLNDFKMPWEEKAAADPDAVPTGFSAVLARFKFVVRRDTFVFLSTCLALLHQQRVMAWLFAAGASAVWMSIVGYRVIRRSEPQ